MRERKTKSGRLGTLEHCMIQKKQHSKSYISSLRIGILKRMSLQKSPLDILQHCPHLFHTDPWSNPSQHPKIREEKITSGKRQNLNIRYISNRIRRYFYPQILASHSFPVNPSFGNHPPTTSAMATHLVFTSDQGRSSLIATIVRSS